MTELAMPSNAVRPSASGRVLAFIVVSLCVHAGLLVALSRIPPRQERAVVKPIEVDIVAPPKPPPPKVLEEKPKPKEKPPPLHIAHLAKPPPKVEDPNPPPPNETPKEPSKPAPVIVGLTLSATSTAGAYAANVGNTLYGTNDRVAQDPKNVHAYASRGKYVPVYQADTAPEVSSEFKPPYPAQAKRDGVEGVVTVKVTIDETGKVTQTKLVDGPGHGLNEAAQEALLHFKFKPAIKDGQAVLTEITYHFRFELPPGI